MMLGIIKRNFRHLTITTFTLIYKTMVRSHLDYCCSLWEPYKKVDIEALEKVQKRATKFLPALRHLTYPDPLKACKLTTALDTVPSRRKRSKDQSSSVH